MLNQDPSTWPVYLFFRDGVFYPVQLPGDEHVMANVECNPGTIRVESIDGRVIYAGSN